MSRSRVELVPFLKVTRSARLFDHNVRGGDLDNYVLSSDNGWVQQNPGAHAADASPGVPGSLVRAAPIRPWDASSADAHRRVSTLHTCASSCP